ncbi:L-selenocysteinyl-tRNA(Sec) synthase [Botrimarina sp.]|uniref:L-selenocysteinyl-tRNA(Sec) synthase n=1 Tax=Botrimarina sp. TaxID=2795802 RepID=UPI0032EB249E
MQGPEFLSQLPSIDELLDNPRIKAAVDRWSRTTAAARVRSAVTTLSAEVSRRAESLQNLAPTELLERIIRQLEQPRSALPTRVINASGWLIGDEWSGPPLASVAIEAASADAESFRFGRPHAAAEAAAGLLRVERACVASSHVAAVSATLEALAGGGACLVARSEMSQLAPGVRLDEICRRAGVRLREVGATDSADLDDYRRAIDEESAAGGPAPLVLRRATAGQVGVAVEELAGLARERGLRLVVDAAWLRPLDDTPSYTEGAASAGGLAAKGADAVILDAAGLMGGPVAGVVAGKTAAIEAVHERLVSRGDQVASLADAALAATIGLFRQPATLRFVHPLYQLLDTPVENLQTRAERIAGRLAASERIESAEAQQVASVCPAMCESPSWAVRVVPAGTTPEALAGRLRKHDAAVHARVGGGALWLDLRAVPPREDSPLVAAVAPESSSGAAEGAAVAGS